jgi:hypothetical protein
MILAKVDIDWGALAEAGYVSAIAGLAVLVIAALAVGSSLLAQDAKAKPGGGGSASAYAAGTIVCVAALAAIVAYGIYLLTQ